MTKEELESKIKENVINNLIETIAKIKSDNIIAEGTLGVLKSLEALAIKEEEKKTINENINKTSQLLSDSQVMIKFIQEKLESMI